MKCPDISPYVPFLHFNAEYRIMPSEITYESKSVSGRGEMGANVKETNSAPD
jgi:hypothetical protein